MRHALPCLVLAASLLLPSLAVAQLGNPWLSFSKQPAQLGVAPTALSDPDTQVFFATGDLDQDSWDDVVAVRKQLASQAGKRPAFLLRNVSGVLTDVTALYASASDVPGDLGFLTPCNNRECVLGDVDGDGWLDVVTATNLSDGLPKAISHPRVYRNLAEDAGGAWQGLLHEDGRIPQLKTVGGLRVAPRFAAVALGDVTADGAPDLYFVDFDTADTGILEPVAWDLNDRLLVNSGAGWFSDESFARLTPAQLDSYFGAATEIVDVNDDGLLDIAKLTTVMSPRVRTIYNDPAHPGDFTAMGFQEFSSGSPYGMDLGDLNRDTFLDMVVVDPATDKFRLGTGYDTLNQLVWGPTRTFTFLNGMDDGFGHNAWIRDLDADGWNDVLVADIDADLPSCTRRLHVYHNTGTVPGDMNLVLREEVELASGNNGAGWKGAVGLTVPDLKGTNAVAFVDWDQDGDADLLIGTCGGTNAFRNETVPTGLCQADLGFGGPGSLSLSLCGAPLTQAGGNATLQLTGAAANAALFLPVSLSVGPVPLKGGQLVPFPVLVLVSGLTTDGSGQFSAPVAGTAGAPLHVYLQAIAKNGTTYEFSNAIDAIFGF